MMLLVSKSQIVEVERGTVQLGVYRETGIFR
jgi:hypothetical protein